MGGGNAQKVCTWVGGHVGACRVPNLYNVRL